MHSIHKGLVCLGMDIQVLADISYVKVPYQEFEGIPIWGVRFPILPRSVLRPSMLQSFIRLKKILRLIKKNMGEIDLVQGTPTREAAIWGFWLARALHVPWVGRIACSGSYGDFQYISKYMSRNWLVKRLLPELLRSCSAAIALDQETYREALENGVGANRVVIIPSAVSFDELPCAENAARMPEDGSLLFLGRIASQKRLVDVLKAYAIFKRKQSQIPNRSIPIFNIVAGGNFNDLKRLASELGIEENVIFCGHHYDVTKFLNQAVCVISASESEGMPNAVLEACAYGVPAILSDIPIHREIAKHTGMTEFLFLVGDENQLSERISKYLSLRKEDVVQKRTLCFKFAQGFSREKRDEAYFALYSRIIRTHGVENGLSEKST